MSERNRRGLVVAALVAALGIPATPTMAQASGGPTVEDKDQQAGERLYQRGIRYAKRGKYEKALQLFEQALPYKNSDSNIFFNLCMVAAPIKKWDKIVLYGRGFLFIDGGQSADSKEIARKVTKAAGLMTVRPRPVKFDMTPKGVEVKVNHVPVGRAQGQEFLLPIGTYTVRAFRDDHEPFEKKITVVNGAGTQIVKLAMTKKIFFGKLLIKTEPADGVTVTIDDKNVGVTPLKDPIKLETRKYLVKFTKPGYDMWQRYVTIEKDQTATLSPVMERSTGK